MSEPIDSALGRAAEVIRGSRRLIAFTGAGISAESGLRTFRGEGGIWNEIDAGLLEIGRFDADPAASWAAIRELFYSAGPAGPPEPNAAHRVLAEWERDGLLSLVITQNIDGLHSAAGSRRVVEFHGSIRELVCRRCGARVAATAEAIGRGLLDALPPRCGAAGAGGRPCGGILKPDFVFFGEGIPPDAYGAAFAAAQSADACLVIGTSGAVHPAALIPAVAARAGAAVVEIDPGETEFGPSAARVRLRLGASEALTRLDALVRGPA